MVRLPPAVAETITYDAKADMTYLDKRITVPGMPGLRRDPIAVRRRDIDFYGHMNNARYVDDAMELLPEGLQPRRLRIEYKAPAKLGQLLYPRIIETGDGKIYIPLTDAADKPYTVMEFTF
jgi:acyl-ACP thioesterase